MHEGKQNGGIKSLSLCEIELPSATPFRQGERCGEVSEKVSPGDFFGAERFAAS
ncbi:MAG TPA: hypothetical protein VLL94_10925 [Nitrospiraceae bacterium]|nr:hypothetical protein [Nitrospiraceae bacterium]